MLFSLPNNFSKGCKKASLSLLADLACSKRNPLLPAIGFPFFKKKKNPRSWGGGTIEPIFSLFSLPEF